MGLLMLSLQEQPCTDPPILTPLVRHLPSHGEGILRAALGQAGTVSSQHGGNRA